MTEILTPPEIKPEAATSTSVGVPVEGRRRILAAAALVAVLAGASFVALSTLGGPEGHGAAAFAIDTVRPGTFMVRVVNSQTSAENMTEQLRAAGLNIVVETAPASPQLVGRWLALDASQGVSAKLRDDIADQALTSTTTLRVPAGFSGNMTLTVGRKPQRGEDIVVVGTPNALAPGGTLFCSQLLGLPAAAARHALTAQGYAVRWATGGARRPLSQPAATDRVVQAFIYDSEAVAPTGFPIDGSTVQVVLADPLDASYDTLRWSGFPRWAHAKVQSEQGGCGVS